MYIPICMYTHYNTMYIRHAIADMILEVSCPDYINCSDAAGYSGISRLRFTHSSNRIPCSSNGLKLRCCV